MPTTLQLDATRERRLRRQAWREGIAVRKDRARTWSHDRQGGYMLIDADRNSIVAGQRFDLTLDDIETWLGETTKPPQRARY